MPSFILVRQIVWPQYTNATDRPTDRTDRQTDNGPIAYGEPFYKRSPKNEMLRTNGPIIKSVVRGVIPEAER